MSESKCVRKILNVYDDEKTLYQRAEEISPQAPRASVLRLIKTLETALSDHVGVIGLSAPQVGENKRMFCIRFSDGKIRTFINPMITHSGEMYPSIESNISIPEAQFLVVRPKTLTAIYQNREGKIEENKFEGFVAAVFQELCQSLDGVYLNTWGLQVSDDFNSASEEDKHTIIKMYVDNLKEKTKILNARIENSPTLKQDKAAVDFMTSIALGETEIVPETESGQIDMASSSIATQKAEYEAEKQHAEQLKKKIDTIVNNGTDKL